MNARSNRGTVRALSIFATLALALSLASCEQLRGMMRDTRETLAEAQATVDEASATVDGVENTKRDIKQLGKDAEESVRNASK